MRPVLPGDLDAASRRLIGADTAQCPAAVAGLLRMAHAADKYRKRFGRCHPGWGNGSLLMAAWTAGLPDARPGDSDYLIALRHVTQGILDWRAERPCRRNAR